MADFETSTSKWLLKEDTARVWLWGLYDIDTDSMEHGIDIDSFMSRVLTRNQEVNPVVYFHNLKYDGSYIVQWLLTHSYTYAEDLNAGTFKTSITDMGLWYTIEVCIYRKGKTKYIIRFQDSLKKIPLPVREIPLAFGFKQEEEKGLIDYDEIRPVGHEPTSVELSYLYHDLHIVARALKILEAEGFTKMTESSDAFFHWKKTLQSEHAIERGIPPEVSFRHLFPKVDLDVDDFIRNAYRGGWTYLNPKYANQIITKPVEVWDINSMYPAKMVNRYLPVGDPVHFVGRPKPNKYQCYIVKVRMVFELKENHLPCIQLKHSYFFNPTDYITSSNFNEVEMTVTNVDLKLIFAQYDVLSINYIEGYYFRKIKGLFDKHITENMKIKETSTGGKRYLAKKRMNTVYGKLATACRSKYKIPYLDENGVLRFKFSEEQIKDPQYTAEGCFITAWARRDIITDAQKNYDKFIYCDTDSLHLLANEDGTEPDLPIHDTHLGYYKKEHSVVKSTFLRSKTYIEQYPNGDIEIKCAGASPEVKKNMNFDNFHIGAVFEGKLMPSQVKGGCVLEKTFFTIN